jgi:hypothetical protein
MQMSPKMKLIWATLERAKDCGDMLVIASCRRLIIANRRGWKAHARPDDIQRVFAFAE